MLTFWVRWALRGPCWKFSTVSSRGHDRRSIYLTMALAEAAGSNNSTIPSSETCIEFVSGSKASNLWKSQCCGVQSEFPLLKPLMKLICRSRTCLHHRFQQLPDTQITPDNTYLHSVGIACEFCSSFLRMKLMILDIKRNVPHLNSHTLPDYQSRRIFAPEGMYNSMPMIGLDCGFVVCKRLRPFEVLHPNDVSAQKGRTRPSHLRHSSYFYKQDIDVSSRDGCVTSVLTCL